MRVYYTLQRMFTYHVPPKRWTNDLILVERVSFPENGMTKFGSSVIFLIARNQFASSKFLVGCRAFQLGTIVSRLHFQKLALYVAKVKQGSFIAKNVFLPNSRYKIWSRPTLICAELLWCWSACTIWLRTWSVVFYLYDEMDFGQKWWDEKSGSIPNLCFPTQITLFSGFAGWVVSKMDNIGSIPY